MMLTGDEVNTRLDSAASVKAMMNERGGVKSSLVVDEQQGEEAQLAGKID